MSPLPALLLALAASAASFTPAFSQASSRALWGGARAGATVEEVRRAFPTGAPPTQSDGLGGARLEWEAPDQLLGGLRFRGRFFFNDGRLAAAQLADEALAPKRTAEHIRVTHALVGKLKVIYGGEPACKEQRTPLMNAVNCDWTSGRLNIGVTYMDIDGTVPMRVVVFRPAA